MHLDHQRTTREFQTQVCAQDKKADWTAILHVKWSILEPAEKQSPPTAKADFLGWNTEIP